MALTLSIGIKQNSQSVANNTSNVTVNVDVSWTYKSYDHYGSTKYVTINGSRYDFNSVKINPNKTNSGSQTLYTTTVNIPHNAAGAGSVSCYAYVKTATGSGTITKSASLNLTTIPRATQHTLSASSVNLGSAVTINMPRASSAFTHTLKYKFESASGTIASGLGTSHQWTVPMNLADQIPNATSGIVAITCETYNGSSLIGTKTVNLTVNVPSSVVPTISGVSIADTVKVGTQTLLQKYGAFVQNKSKPKATISAQASHSTIKQYKITYQGSTLLSDKNNVTLGVLTTKGNVKIVAEVTDGRGRTASKEVTISSLAYGPPAISVTAIRCNSDGTVNDDGTSMKIICKVTITSLNSKNSKSVSLKYKKKTATTWTTQKTWGAYSVNESVIIAADGNSSYDIQLVATDDFSGSTPATSHAEIGTHSVIMDFKSNGKGMAIGKVSEADRFEVAWNTQINKALTILGALTVGGRNILNEIDGKVQSSGVTGEDGGHKMALSWNGSRVIVGIDNNAAVKTLLDTSMVIDYIIGHHISGGWEYIKWASGRVEAWRRWTSNNLATNGTQGGFYYRIYALTLPSGLFKSITDAHADCHWGTGTSWASARNVTTEAFEGIYYSNQNGGAGTFYNYVRGKWK